jgi:hypothetical protein
MFGRARAFNRAIGPRRRRSSHNGQLARDAIDHRLNDLELLRIRQRVRLAGAASGYKHNPLAGASFHQESGVGLETV